MNEQKDQDDTLKGKFNRDTKSRPTIDRKSRLFKQIFNFKDDKAKRGSKPCEGVIELPENFQDHKERHDVLNPGIKEQKLENLPANNSYRTLGSSNHPRNSYSRSSKFETRCNPRQSDPKTKRSNLNKNSSITRSDESINIEDKSSEFCNRTSWAYNNSRDFNNPRKTRGYPKNGTGFSNGYLSNKSREISRSDESVNQNFTPKEEFQQNSVKRYGTVNGVPLSKLNSLYDKTQKFCYENRYPSKNSNTHSSKSNYGTRKSYGNAKENPSTPFNPDRCSDSPKEYSGSTSSYRKESISKSNAKENPSTPFNPDRCSDSPKEYSRSTSSYRKESISKSNAKGNHPRDGITSKTKVSDTVNRKEKSPNAVLNISKDTPFNDHNDRKDNNRLPSPNGEKNLHQANKPTNSPFDGYRSDDGSASISDEPEDSSYKPRKQRLKKEKKPLDGLKEWGSEPLSPPLINDKEFSFDLNCPIPPPHDVDTFLTVYKDDDTESVSSENLEPMENYDLPSPEEELNKLEDSESSDENIGPELEKSVANYLEKLEKDELKNLAEPNKVVKEVNSIFNRVCEGDEVSLYGSYLSGLAVELSNINLVLKSEQPGSNRVLLMLQRALSEGLSKEYDVDPFQEEKYVRQSKICFYTRTSVQCVIMYNMKPVSDYYKTDMLLKKIHEFDPRVKTLIIAARKWVEACCMDENGNNVLHPIGLALLVVYFLQHNKPAILPIIDTSAEDLGLNSSDVRNNIGVGELWFKFLKFYSKMFDWETNVVTIQHKDVLLKSDVNWENASVAIQEPYSRKNITESFNTSEYIHSCFKAYYEHLLMGPNNSDSDTDENSSDCSKDGKYSFRDSRIKCPLPVFCEDCAELEEELCEKCQKEKSDVSRVIEKLPEITDHSMKCIDKALLHVYNTVSLTEGNMKGRQVFVTELEEYIRKIFPDAQLKLFGSSVNMFGLKKSDLDICMTLRNRSKDIIDAKNILKRVINHLRKKPWEYSGVLGLFQAKVPIVKFYSEKGHFLCDLSLYNVLSVHNSRLLSKYAVFDERCRIIGCALKYLTMKGWISDSSSKCLSSYSYILMVIHYLQQTSPPVLPVLSLEDREVFINNIDIPNSAVTNKNYWYYETAEELRKRYKVFPRNESSTAELWLGFFDYYLKFDRSFAVTITQKEPMPASELLKRARLFNIEDPFEYKRNLGGVLSEENANKTQGVFLKARSLFGRNVPPENHNNVQNHYFSTNNLLGKVGKEVECNFCGAFDHESGDCLKKDPFKKSTIRNSHPATRPGRRRK